MARHVNIISNQFSNYLSSPLKLHITKVPTCMFLLILCLCVCVSTTCLESKLYILQCARSIGVTASENRAQKWMARHVNIISSQFRNYLSSPLKLHITKVPTCMFLLILCLCVCVSTTCLESKLYILQCARSIGVTASENRAQKWMARHVNIISNQFSNYLSSPLKLHMTKVPTCMFLLILCLCVCVNNMSRV